MRTIILTYPGFGSLPRGVKQLLLATESFYFGEPESAAANAQFVKPKDVPSVPLPIATQPGQPAELRAAA